MTVDKTVPFLSPANEPESSAADLSKGANDAGIRMSAADDTIDKIRYWHRQRRYAMDQRKRLDLALGAFVRMMLGWRKDLPDAERKAIATAAAAMVDNPEGSEWEQVILAQIEARAPFAANEAKALKNMKALAETLPVWTEFCAPIRGFGSGSLAVILAEAGPLQNYATIAKLWKRMGLAVMDGVRQGGLAKGSGAEAWIAHGYSPVRRSFVWNIGDTMIKGNRDGVYRTCYLARKAYELARDPAMAPIKAHRRAQRYMEKRLLKHLWQAWRRAVSSVAEVPRIPVPDAEIRVAA